jgi:Heavy metal associated domain 2
LRQQPELATPLADALERLAGLERVEVRPYTGSVLCTYDPGLLSEEALLAEVKRHTGVELVGHPGELTPEEEEELLRAIRSGSNLAVEASRFFKGLNVDVLRATEGRLDMPTLAAMTFMTAGAVEVIVTRNLPLPPWFNLGWWAFRMFTSMEKKAIKKTEPPLWPGNGARNHEAHGAEKRH